jgi:hypothetical protein
MALLTTFARYYGQYPWFDAVVAGLAAAGALVAWNRDRPAPGELVGSNTHAFLAILFPALIATAWGYTAHPDADTFTSVSALLYLLNVVCFMVLVWRRAGRALKAAEENPDA